MPRDASELARRLAQDAEAVCRHYLSEGRRQGRYWTVGDVRNTPGRSMFVRLSGPDCGPGAAGRWTDAASAEHGDLLDVIRESCGLVEFREVAEEARRFLALPRAEAPREPRPPALQGSPESARRLWAMARPLAGTLAEAYLHARGISDLRGCETLRFHPRCWYRGDDDDLRDRARDAWPALIAAVTALDGTMTGAHRTWLDPGPACKAPVSTPRRAMGLLLGNAVRFGRAADVMVAGEGLERSSRFGRSCPRSRRRRRSRPTTSPRSNCPPDCDGSTSRETTIPQDTVRCRPWPTARVPLASRR
jgi:hypothetical protein